MPDQSAGNRGHPTAGCRGADLGALSSRASNGKSRPKRLRQTGREGRSILLHSRPTGPRNQI
eukprot:1167595-Pyramimonas_sp.AAC.1